MKRLIKWIRLLFKRQKETPLSNHIAKFSQPRTTRTKEDEK